MKLTTSLCGKMFRYETPADLIDQIKPLMQKAESNYKAGETKAKAAYKKSMEAVEEDHKAFNIYRKVVEQLGGIHTAESTPAPEQKTNAS